MQHSRITNAVVCAVFGLASFFGAQNCVHADVSSGAAQSIVVSGTVKTKLTLTVSEVQTQFAGQIKNISYNLKGVAHTSNAVPLEVLIDAAGPLVDPHVKNAMLQATVSVTGEDGYTVVFSWGELLPKFGNEPVWVALDQDGKPLSTEDGPVELILPNDVEAGRWVHAVSSIEINSSQK